MTPTYFTPGPAQLYPTVPGHIRQALEDQIGSVSHRSGAFRALYQHLDEGLRQLLSIPASHAILLTASATEVWERVLQNCVEHESFHCVNGSFSRKFYDFAGQLGRYAHLFEKPAGEGFVYEEFLNVTETSKKQTGKVEIPAYAELVALTANETATGVQMRAADINRLKRSYRSKLFCVDMVSSAPYHDLDYSEVDSAFFSVQKAFGLPAGLGVWIVGESLLHKADNLLAQGHSVGSYHSLPVLYDNYRKFETPETPNVWNIYLLGKVVEDLNRIGIETLRKETDAKARLLYQFLDKTEGFAPAVARPELRSPTVVVADVKHTPEVLQKAESQGFVIGSGYGKAKDTQIRIANFPATSAGQIEALLQALRP